MLLCAGACRSLLLEEEGDGAGGPELDLGIELDLAAPPDLTVVRDLAAPPDLTAVRDLAGPTPDLARCELSPPDAGAGGCPCGSSEGLCRPATGRLVVQTRTPGGVQRLVVMDDNGCRRFEVSRDLPLGTPKWSPDGERLGYVTGTRSSAVLHVLRVGALGQVLCHASVRTGVQANDVAWISDRELWLFSSTEQALVRWRLGSGVRQRIALGARRFDAVGEGPLAYVVNPCGSDRCATEVRWRPQAADPAQSTVFEQDPGTVGPIRLRRDGLEAVWESDGLRRARLELGAAIERLGSPGDRSPAFALGGQAIVHTTDDGQLRYHLIGGPEAGRTLVIPPSWDNVYSPDWSPPPLACQPPPECF